jgi:hypothetical protein
MTDAEPRSIPEPGPEIDGINEPHWLGLKEGKLRYQACACGHNWLPPRLLCPRCLEPGWAWRDAAGHGQIVSWVVYHVAYHPAFKDKLPYNVAIVELDEGPRLITNILDANDRLSVGARVQLEIDTARETPLAQFRLV